MMAEIDSRSPQLNSTNLIKMILFIKTSASAGARLFNRTKENLIAKFIDYKIMTHCGCKQEKIKIDIDIPQNQPKFVM